MKRWAGPALLSGDSSLQAVTPRLELSYPLTPWESEEVDPPAKQNPLTSRKEESPSPQPVAELKQIRRRRLRRNNTKAEEKYVAIPAVIIGEESPNNASNVEVFARHYRSISIEDQNKSRSKKKLRLPSLSKIQALPVKLTLNGRKMKHEDHPSYSPGEVHSPQAYDYQRLEMREITPINLVEEIRRRHKVKSNRWLGERREFVLSQLYSQIRSTIRLT
jgi:hypothetical protein